EVMEALRNDLNVPGALARLHVLLTQLNNTDTDARRAHAKSVLLASAGVMGLLQRSPQEALAVLRSAPASVVPSSADMRVETLLAEREQARRERKFSKADALRKELEEAGFGIEDTPAGPVLRPVAKGTA
ncbi:MAG: hypothetical protein MI921_29350, partial [Cytophagales bacterium]|nr:hypothetical protein [Cytophagales bacterium]